MLGQPWVPWGHTELAGLRVVRRSPQERSVLGEPGLWVECTYFAVRPWEDHLTSVSLISALKQAICSPGGRREIQQNHVLVQCLPLNRYSLNALIHPGVRFRAYLF